MSEPASARFSPARRLAATKSVPIVVVLVMIAFLSACAGIPSKGPVVPGRAVRSDPREGVFQVIPEGPRPGASPEGIVLGFIRAAAGSSNDHRVARSFLTAQRRLAWRPDASVSVYPGESSLSVKEVGGSGSSTVPSIRPGTEADDRAQVTKVNVQTPIQARIDGDGRYRIASPGERVTTTFNLVKTGGEWRISSLTDGILVAGVDFAVTFRPFPVYFPDPSGRYLVPDLHWFAGTRDQPGSRELPTALVRVLLEGPPPWLRGAVTTGAPARTRMAVAAVVVSADVATVDLTDPVRAANGRARQLLVSQLQATLGQLRTIGAVQITVRRLAFDVPPGAGGSNDPSQPAARPQVDPPVDGRPVVIDARGRLARLDGGKLVPVKGVGGLAVPGANRPAVSTDSSSAYAVLNADRSKLLLQLPGTKVVTLIHSAGLTAPSFDPQGWVWAASGTTPGQVYAAGIDPGAVKVRAPWLRRFQVVSLRVSRDGTRAAIAVRVRGRAHVFISGVIRDAQGRPEALSQPIGLMPDLKTVTDLAWVDEDEVVVLGRRAGTGLAERPWVVQIGGTVRSASSIPGAESIAAGNGELMLMVGTANGILARSGARWQRVTSARWPAFPG
jgi:hypothetical protein